MALRGVFWRTVGLRMSIRSISLQVFKEQTAATTVEYGLILAMIVLVVVVAISGAADETVAMWNSIYSKSDAAISAS